MNSEHVTTQYLLVKGVPWGKEQCCLPNSLFISNFLHNRFYTIPSSRLYPVVDYTQQYTIPSSILYPAVDYTQQYTIPSSRLYPVVDYNQQYTIPSSILYPAVYYTQQYTTPGSILYPVVDYTPVRSAVTHCNTWKNVHSLLVLILSLTYCFSLWTTLLFKKERQI